MSSRGSNFLAIQGALFPRPGVSYVSSLAAASGATFPLTAQPFGWIGECPTGGGVLGDFRQLYGLANQTPCVFSQGSWHTLEQTGAAGFSGATLASNTTSFFDAVTYFHPTSDSFELCFVNSITSGAFTVRPDNSSNAFGFSALTNAPGAKYVTVFDNRLVFANIAAPNAFPQRVQWSARGNPELYTAPDGGFEELLDARGVITRVMTLDDRLIIFFGEEIWQGLKAPFPFTFSFSQMHPTVGTDAPWSVTETPHGLVFLGSDLNVYLLPRGSGSLVPLGGDTWRLLKENIPQRAEASPMANGVYVNEWAAYVLTYRSLSSKEQGMVFPLDRPNQAPSPIGFDKTNWAIMRLGTTSLQSNQASSSRGGQRILIADNGSSAATAAEMNSRFTSDLGAAIDCRYFTLIGNPDPTTRMHVREVRLDYRATSASSVSLRMSPDFGTTYPVDTGVALPVNAQSGQSVVGVSMTAIYPGVELRHASGHTFALQGLSAVVESMGNG